jgi:hypothetical protein
MKRIVVSTAAMAVLALTLAGCLGDMRTVATLDPGPTTRPINQTMAVTEKGTYYLYSTKEPNEPKYKTEMRKGDTIGFQASGDRAQGVANGIRVELSDYSEGAGYQWKVEEKKGDK